MTDPDSPLPPYTHIPGVTPHPIGDPQGHSFGATHPVCIVPGWSDLTTGKQFQRGRQLFNAGYYWEAHEAWEGVWIAAGRTGMIADFVKGLIKLAAAGVKLREGSAAGTQRHLARAEELLLLTQTRYGEVANSVASSDGNEANPSPTGVCLERALERIANLKASLPDIPDKAGGRPVVLLGQL